jgi:hypothetical protein
VSAEQICDALHVTLRPILMNVAVVSFRATNEICRSETPPTFTPNDIILIISVQTESTVMSRSIIYVFSISRNNELTLVRSGCFLNKY